MKKHSVLKGLIFGVLVYLIFTRVIMPGEQKKDEVTDISYSQMLELVAENSVKKIELKDISDGKGIAIAFDREKDDKSYSAKIPNIEIFLEYVQNEILNGGKIEISEVHDISTLDTLSILFNLIFMLLPLLLLASLFFSAKKILKKDSSGMPAFLNMGGMNSSHIEIVKESNVKFSDVAGLDEEKEELTEIVDFMKYPEKYLRLGAKIPKGALLSGPPGTGKTLLAKAVAGEAGVSFISVAGSHFVEMFVGLGASRVRDLFKEARKNAPCIIFIDEIDAIGSKRSSSNNGGSSEHDQTLEQLLFELDGFKDRTDVILLAATNRPDSLDPALTRPGRFDRKIEIRLPDIAARLQILQIHAKDKPFMDDVDFKKLAYNTAGCSGAELANFLNEAALISARNNMSVINNNSIDAAFRKISVGLQKHNKIITDKEKRLTSVHELGHVITSLFCKTQTDIKEISIIPTTKGAGGYTMNNAKEDQMYRTKTELFERIMVLLGGRVAEEYLLGEISTGASNDLKVATRIAGEMVSIYGMDKDIGPISVADTEYTERSILGEEIFNKMGERTSNILKDAESQARIIIHTNIDLLNYFTEILLEKEVLTEAEIKKIFEDYNR